MRSFTLREAMADDARAVAEVQLTGWREAYGDWLTPDFWNSVSVESQTTRLGARVGQPGVLMMVAESDGAIVGYAVSGPRREPDAPRQLELYALYQLAAMHGSGSGQALLDAVIGTRPAYLWVLAKNGRAQSFYRRNGFETDRVTRPLEYFEGLIEGRMVRR